MKLDSNLAWQEAQAAIRANREVLTALAGVFFLVPMLALALLYPQPKLPAGVTLQQATAVMEEFYRQVFPFFVPVMILEVIGVMAIMTLFTDRTRPTVGGAIGHGVVDAVVFLGAALVVWVASTLIAAVAIGLAAATGLAPLTALVTAICLAVLLYSMVRFSMVMPVIAVEDARNPLIALRRSWSLTGGNAGRIFVFILLLFIVYMVISLALVAVAGIAFTLIGGLKASQIAAAVLTGLAGSAFNVYVIAVLAMIHRQLSGGAPKAVFD